MHNVKFISQYYYVVEYEPMKIQLKDITNVGKRNRSRLILSPEAIKYISFVGICLENYNNI